MRRQGVGRALIAAVEVWARKQGLKELGSDTELENGSSIAAHAALGFEPTQRLQCFRKRLEP
jgi:aminoglycoside 6'-N-acetyltransferase I